MTMEERIKNGYYTNLELEDEKLGEELQRKLDKKFKEEKEKERR